MKITVSISECLFEGVERLRSRLGVSRSALFEMALSRIIERQQNADIEALNAVYDDPANRTLDPLVWAASEAALTSERW